MKKVIKGAALIILSTVLTVNSALCSVDVFACDVESASFLVSENFDSETNDTVLNDNSEDSSSEDSSHGDDAFDDDNYEIEISADDESGCEASEDEIIVSSEESSSNEDQIAVDNSAEEIIVSDDNQFDAEAATSGKCGENATWSYDKSTKTLTISGSGPMENYTANAGAPWLKLKDEVQKVVIGHGITKVGSYAFYQFVNASELSWGNEITEVGRYAFYNFSSKTTISKDSAKLVKLPAKLQIVRENAFEYASHIKFDANSFPDSVTRIEWSAFSGTSYMTGNLNLPGTLTYLGERAFRWCGVEGKVTIPTSITEIGYDAFYGCKMTSLALHDGIKKIGTSAFRGCINCNFGKFVLPKGLEVINDEAFWQDNFEEVIFGENIKRVYGFRNIDLGPGNVIEKKGIPLTIRFKGDIPVFSKGNFIGFDGYVVTAYYPKDNPTWTKEAMDEASKSILDVTWVKEGEKPRDRDEDTDITWSYNKSTKTLNIGGTGKMADYNINHPAPWSGCFGEVETVVFGDNVENIGSGALLEAGKVKSITIGKKVESIGRHAFSGTVATELVFPKSLKQLSVEALYYTKVNTMIFEGNPPELEQARQLGGRSGDTEVFYPADNANWTEEYADQFNKLYSNHLYPNHSIPLYFFPNKPVSNKCGANLTWKIENNVLKISGSGAMTDYSQINAAPWFRRAYSFNSVQIGQGVTSIGSFAFVDMYKSKNQMTLPSTLKEIGAKAFYYSSGFSLKVPAGTKIDRVGKMAFEYAAFSSEGFVSAIKDASSLETSAFSQGTSSEFLNLETNAREIGSWCFYTNRAMKSVKLGPNTKKLDSAAFYDCSGIKTIDLGNVEYIGGSAFYNISVETLKLPDSLTELGDSALPKVTKTLYVGKKLKDISRQKLGSEEIDVYFESDYIPLDSYKKNRYRIHYPRYNATWLDGIDSLGETNLTFIPEGKDENRKYTVKFVTNCSGKLADVTVAYGERVSEPKLSNSGYTLEGWYTEKEFKNKYCFEKRVTESFTLYAKWNRITKSEWGDITEKDRKEKGFVSSDDVKNVIWIAGVSKERTFDNKKPITFPDLHVYDYKTLLKSGRDYTLKYVNNTKAGDAQIIITFKGNYKGTEKVDFSIKPLDLAMNQKRTLVLEDGETTYVLGFTYHSVHFDGKVRKLKPSVYVLRNGVKIPLKEKVDFNYIYDDKYDYTKPGKYPLAIEGIGNYKGKTNVGVLTIVDKIPLDAVTAAKIPDQTATGLSILPFEDIKLTYKGKTLKFREDYEISDVYNDHNVGIATISLVGIGKFDGYKALTFKIVSRPISKCTVDGLDTPVTYQGGAFSFKNIKLYEADEEVDSDYYKVSYSGNTKAGTAKVTFTGKGIYKGMLKKTFKILPFEVNDTVAVRNATGDAGNKRIAVKMNSSYAYTKGGTKPSMEVYFKTASGAKEILTNGKDYTINYKNCASLGKATATITFKGNFKGKLSDLNYEITNANIKACSASASNVTYKNVPGICKPSISIVDTNGAKLVAGKDYDNKNVTYTYATDASVARYSDSKKKIISDTPKKVTKGSIVSPEDIIPAGCIINAKISGKGVYEGSVVTCSFRYVSKAVSKVKVSVNKTYYYTGSQIKPGEKDITVTDGKEVLTAGKDFRIVSCKNNVKAGKANLTIEGLGNYGGTKTVSFTIWPKFWP